MGRFLKTIAIVFLSIFLIHSSVAWAVSACLQEDDRVDHAAPVKGEPHRGHHSLSVDSDWPDPSRPILHCPDLRFHIGPMVGTSPTRLVRLTISVSLKDSSFSGLAAPIQTKYLWLRASFQRSLLFSFLNGTSYRLFLSIIQI